MYCGVPQGSVLGPLLWNLAYDRVLRIALPLGCGVICYADDTLVAAGKIDWRTAQACVNLGVARVVRAIRATDLMMSPQKTEAIFLHNGSRGAPPQAHIWVEDSHPGGGPNEVLGLTLDGT